MMMKPQSLQSRQAESKKVGKFICRLMGSCATYIPSAAIAGHADCSRVGTAAVLAVVSWALRS
jgi:hypothetical protein